MNKNWQEFLSTQGAVLDNNVVQGFEPFEAPYYSEEETYLCDLSSYGIIQATGEDTQSFLHGQFTNDLNHVTETISQISGYCNPKGRLLSVFRVFIYENKYFLLMPKDVLEPVLNKLSMFKLMAKVDLTDVSNDFAVFGLAGARTEYILDENEMQLPLKTDHCIQYDGATVINVPGVTSRALFISTPEKAEKIWNALSEKSKKTSSNIWQLYDIHAGIPQITSETFEAFTPQMVNLELIGGVNFQKGCYPGQEIVARTHYLGKPNRRMYKIDSLAEQTFPPSTNIYSEEDGEQPVGKIVSCVRFTRDNISALTVLRTERENSNHLKIGAINGPTALIRTLPYDLNPNDSST